MVKKIFAVDQAYFLLYFTSLHKSSPIALGHVHAMHERNVCYLHCLAINAFLAIGEQSTFWLQYCWNISQLLNLRSS